MKRITVIFGMLILFCVTVFAQNKMDTATFEHLVDYANCKYLMAFIERNDKSKPYFKDIYEKKVKPVLQTATLDNLNNVPDYNKIKALFPDGTNKEALQLAEKINERKGKYNKYSDDKSLIESLTSKSWGNIDLTGTAKEIKEDIYSKFNSASTNNNTNASNENSVDSQQIKTSSFTNELATNEKLQQQIETLQDKLSTFQMVAIFCLVAIVLFIVSWLFWYKSQLNTANRNSSLRKFVKNVFFSSEEINDKFEFIKTETYANGVNTNESILEKKLDNLKRQFDELQPALKSIIATDSQKSIKEETNPVIPVIKSPEPKQNEFYFASKSNKQLTEQLPNSANASFKVYEITGNEAKFEYIGSVRNENWFEGVCSIENSANDNLSDKKHISTTKPGRVRKFDNFWIVSTPASIKFS
jgi:hypothetical protein